MGFEPTTLTLARLCSTPELHPHPANLPRQKRNFLSRMGGGNRFVVDRQTDVYSRTNRLRTVSCPSPAGSFWPDSRNSVSSRSRSSTSRCSSSSSPPSSARHCLRHQGQSQDAVKTARRGPIQLRQGGAARRSARRHTGLGDAVCADQRSVPPCHSRGRRHVAQIRRG